MATDYGSLGAVIATTGSLTAAAAALVLSFKGRARWEPSEQSVPKLAEKVAGAVIAMAIGFIFIYFARKEALPALTYLGIGLGIGIVLFAAWYIVLVTVYVYEATDYVPAKRRFEPRNIIGGYALTNGAKDELYIRKTARTIKELYKNAQYDEDLVWTRPSRALAKVSFTLCYIGLVASGAIGLAVVSIALAYAFPDVNRTP
jgi:hypothetical protein